MSDDLFSKNYFEIFSVPVSVDVDMTVVSDHYHVLQKKYHPDRFANTDEQQSRMAMQATSLINSAFDTLKSPLLRAQYLLKLKGVDTNNETDTTMDGAFLMQQMELRESLESVRDDADPLSKLDSIGSDLKKQMKRLMSEFQQAYDSDSLEQARESIRKMQFILKAQNEVKQISEQIEDEML